ncbi:MAG: PPK2 family polyphosphate:nucleotide phosphotransferase [Myxococcota bacterium]|jgi:PPK2 family polyphosphate:nucleotide phosphotransferase
MPEYTKSPYLVPFDGSFSVANALTTPEDPAKKSSLKKKLKAENIKLREQQRRLYADDRWSVLMIFQAMDAAGKDGTIRAVLSGVNPAGCQVYSFKQPSAEELDHDFLWRTACRLPERGRLGVFNRSYYEEVLVARVHPGIISNQKLPRRPEGEALWTERLESIAEHEKHLARNGTIILKFWLNVSAEEQRQRLLARIEDPTKNWKFSGGDVKERGHWSRYMAAYEQALNKTSTPMAPWYAIPADNKPFMRVAVADILRRTLERLELKYPTLSSEQQAQLSEWESVLQGDTLG